MVVNEKPQARSPASASAFVGAGAGGGAGAGSATARRFLLAAQHERLLLELLPFKEAAQFHDWLGFLDGDWAEYCCDHLDGVYDAAAAAAAGAAEPGPAAAADLLAPEPDKAKTAQRAKDVLQNQQVAFLAYHPDKTGWTADDHAVRFVATAVADSLLRKVWSERDWRKQPLDIARAVYEVLSFRRASYVEQRELLRWQQQHEQQQQQHQQQRAQREAAGGPLHPQQQHILDSPPEYSDTAYPGR